MVKTRVNQTTPDKDTALYDWLQEHQHNVQEDDNGLRKSSRIRKLTKTHTPPADEKHGGPAQLARKTAGNNIIKPKVSQPLSPASSPLQEPSAKKTEKTTTEKKSDAAPAPAPAPKKTKTTKTIQPIILVSTGSTTRVTNKPADGNDVDNILPAVNIEVTGQITAPSHQPHPNIKPPWSELSQALIDSLSDKRYANVVDQRHHSPDFTPEIVFLIKVKKVRSAHSSARVFESVTV